MGINIASKISPSDKLNAPRSLTATYISRLARRGGVIRMKQEIYDEVRTVVRSRLEVVLKQVVLILDSSTTHKRNRKVVTSRD
ncbi:uncharacterized protein ATNIH1004_001430 [Aspergillus tanneri]|uniref:Histone H4 n=1 Tax=Aspergillus tanneri TaxID=1220188 RepID=A0A5M9N2I1_9EURO|nr:uncharacterized protein ATNIH1004_001430 [Aspergillus tanneri]KAA8652526.1 hypothetical protein ATNIH1004_001430 [Aspergillus tanneri]